MKRLQNNYIERRETTDHLTMADLLNLRYRSSNIDKMHLPTTVSARGPYMPEDMRNGDRAYILRTVAKQTGFVLKTGDGGYSLSCGHLYIGLKKELGDHAVCWSCGLAVETLVKDIFGGGHASNRERLEYDALREHLENVATYHRDESVCYSAFETLYIITNQFIPKRTIEADETCKIMQATYDTWDADLLEYKKSD